MGQEGPEEIRLEGPPRPTADLGRSDLGRRREGWAWVERGPQSHCLSTASFSL